MRSLARASASLALLALALAAAAPARADTPEEARAEALFREGREAVERGDFDKACAKFGGAVALTRRPGPLLNLANCEEHLGRLVAARAHWEEGIGLLPKGDERVEVSGRRFAELVPRIPALTITLAPGAPPSSTPTLDGAPIAAAALGKPLPVDPGDHVIVVSAPGRADGRSALKLAEGERRAIAVAPGDAVTAVPPVIPPAGSGLRTAGFVLGGAGVASLLAGAITGGLTIAKKNAVNDNCTPGCNDAARDAATAGKTFSTVSTVTFIAGGALAAAGVVLVLMSRAPQAAPSAALAPSPLPGGGGLLLRGTF